MDIVLKGGKLVTPTDMFEADIGIKDGRIAAISNDLEGDKLIDISGKIVVPGAIDAHTHMEFPFMGTTSADDFYDGTVAAACGGTTTIIDFILPKPSQGLLDAYSDYRKRADEKVVIDYGLHMIVRAQNLSDVSKITQIVGAGVPSFKLFMTYRSEGLMLDDSQLFKVMEEVGKNKGIVAVHAENNGIIENLVEENLSQGRKSAKYHALSKPAIAEAEAVVRASHLAHAAKVPLYIVHLSSKLGKDAVELMRSQGFNVFAETCPHYLVLTADVYDRPDGRNFVMSPPLRSKEDCVALWDGIKNGSIRTIGSDHCPFKQSQKDLGKDDFTKIPNGVPGTEVIIPILFSEGVRKGRISIHEMVAVTSYNPAIHFGLYPKKGSFTIGADADLVVIDPKKQVKLTADNLHTKIEYSVYEDFVTEGYPVLTLSRGEIVMQDGQIIAKKGRGKFVPRSFAEAVND